MTFGNVLHHELLFKLNSQGIYRNLLILFERYLSQHTQYGAISNQASSLNFFSTGVPQGSILGPFFH